MTVIDTRQAHTNWSYPTTWLLMARGGLCTYIRIQHGNDSDKVENCMKVGQDWTRMERFLSSSICCYSRANHSCDRFLSPQSVVTAEPITAVTGFFPPLSQLTSPPDLTSHTICYSWANHSCERFLSSSICHSWPHHSCVRIVSASAAHIPSFLL